MLPARSERPHPSAPTPAPQPARPSPVHLASEADEAGACPVQSLHERLMLELAPPPQRSFDPIWVCAAAILGATVWGLYAFGQALLHGWPYH